MNNIEKSRSNPYLDYIEHKMDNSSVDTLINYNVHSIANCVRVFIDNPKVTLHTKDNEPIEFWINPVFTFGDQSILAYASSVMNVENKEEMIAPMHLATILFAKALEKDGTRVYKGKSLKETFIEILNYPSEILTEIDIKLKVVYENQFNIMREKLIETLQDKANEMSKSAKDPDNIMEKSMNGINTIAQMINKMPLEAAKEPAINGRFFESAKLQNEEQKKLNDKASKK